MTAVAVDAPVLPAAVVDRQAGDWWVFGGVAAELAGRLAVPVGFIRCLLVLGSIGQGDVIFAYIAAALLMPRAGHRLPGPVNLIAVMRIAIAVGLVWGLVGGDLSLNQGLFDAGPAVWVTQCGVCLAGLLALVATGRPAEQRDALDDLRTVRAGAPIVGLAAVIALGVVLAPGVRWDRVLAGAVLLAGCSLLLPGSRGRVIPAGVLAAAMVVIVGAGVRLDGGAGDLRVTPRTVPTGSLTYRRAAGQLTVDLTALPATREDVVVRASVGIGTLIVDVPAAAQVTVVEQVGRGELGEPSPHSGFDLRRSRVVAAIDAPTGRPISDPTLRLRILATVGVGRVEIDRTDAYEYGAAL